MECVPPELGVLTIALEPVGESERGQERASIGAATELAPDKMKFKVTIVGAQNLVAMDMGGTSDAFCRLYRGFESVGTTTTKMKTLSPAWGEAFTVDFTGENRSKPLRITVLDYDFICATGTGEFLGKLEITNAELVAIWKRQCRLDSPRR